MTRKLKTDTLANSEDPDEMPLYAALHLGLHRLLKDRMIFRERSIIVFGDNNM